MLFVPPPTEFGWRLDSHAGRPASTRGVAITPGNNTKGSYFTVQTALPFDVYAVEVWFTSSGVSATLRDTLVDIAVDPAGGTAYSPIILPNLHGGFANASFAASGGQNGAMYDFPIFIPAGYSVGARASVNNATVGTIRCFMIFYGKPDDPLFRSGSVVEAIGANTAASNGTAITSGTTNEGTWTNLGTVTLDAWWWQVGVGCSDTTMATITYGVDLAAGSSAVAGDPKKMILEDVWFQPTSSETGVVTHPRRCTRKIAAGMTIWGRMQCSGTADSGLSMIAYALS